MAVVKCTPSPPKERVLLTGRNFVWASEMSGKPQEELRYLWLEALYKGVACSVEVE